MCITWGMGCMCRSDAYVMGYMDVYPVGHGDRCAVRHGVHMQQGMEMNVGHGDLCQEGHRGWTACGEGVVRVGKHRGAQAGHRRDR